MKSLTRAGVSAPTKLLMRILERPGLVAAVRDLPGAVLGKLIDRIGLEDAGDLVALATTAQLERVFDDDLWRAEKAGDDETFRPERFALWLRVMLETGEAFLVQRLCELPQDLLALAVHRLVLVLDMDILAEQLGEAGEEAQELERALESSVFEEWEEFRLIARDPDVWDDVWSALLSLDRDHHDRLREILEQCCAMSTEYISGQGGLFQVLTADEMLESDVGAARDDRRSTEGFVSAADARAFLELARRGERENEVDPITRAYFRGLQEAPKAPQVDQVRKPDAAATQLASAAHASELAALLRDAEIVAPPHAQRFAALTDGSAERKLQQQPSKSEQPYVVAPLFERALSDLRERDPELFSTRVREVGYLANVWIAGGTHEGRSPRPAEALEMALQTCEAGMRRQLAQKATLERAAERTEGALAGEAKRATLDGALGAPGEAEKTTLDGALAKKTTLDGAPGEDALAVLVENSAVTLFRRGFHGAGAAARRGRRKTRKPHRG